LAGGYRQLFGLVSYRILALGPGPSIGGEKLLCYDNPSFFYHVSFTDSILPGNLQHTCFDLSKLGVAATHIQSTEIYVFPNPLTGSLLNLRGTHDEQIVAIHIYDMAGRVVSAPSLINAQDDIQLSLPIPPGVYILKAEFSDHSIVAKMLTKL
jgi:hypothetical protein